MNEIETVISEIESTVNDWEPILSKLTSDIISMRKNSQNRTIKQILGHLIDSASNNTHRIIHLQYQPLPFMFPNYATFGNNDKWIAIQDYQNEDWNILIQLWKYSLLHVAHVIKNVNPNHLNNDWIAGPGETVTLKAMILDFPRHLYLHLSEIEDLMNKA